MSGIEMFLLRPHEGAPPDTLERIAENVSREGGLILMATQGGSLIVGMPEGGKDALEADPLVGFVGGVSLNEDAKGAKALRQQFALNAARQLVAEGQPDAVPEIDQPPTRRQRWPT